MASEKGPKELALPACGPFSVKVAVITVDCASGLSQVQWSAVRALLLKAVLE